MTYRPISKLGQHLSRWWPGPPAISPQITKWLGTKPPKVILFIGHHKVGSSSLQDYLSRNALSLLRAGILYPSVESEGHARLLAAALGGKDDTRAQPINLREAHNALAFQMLAEAGVEAVPSSHRNLPHSSQMFCAMRNQIDVLRPRAVILCAEVFANFAAVSPQLIEQIRDFFSGSEVTILATLRRPDDYLVSWSGQRVKFGIGGPSLRDSHHLRDFGKTIHIDYAMMLRAWTEVFKDNAKFVIRNYQDVLKSGGAIDDFKAHSGIEFPKTLQTIPNRNPSLPLAITEIARRANDALDPVQARQLRRYLIKWSKWVALPVSKEIECFGYDNRVILSSLFSASNEFLNQFHPTGAFFPDFEDINRTRLIPELEAAAIALKTLRPLLLRSRLPSDVREFIAALSW